MHLSTITVFILFKILCVRFLNYFTTNVEGKDMKKLFPVSRCASRRYVSSSSRNYVARMQNILLSSSMNFIISSQCMCLYYVHIFANKQMKHKKAFPISPAILAVPFSAFALQILHSDSSRFYFTTCYD